MSIDVWLGGLYVNCSYRHLGEVIFLYVCSFKLSNDICLLLHIILKDAHRTASLFQTLIGKKQLELP